MHSEFSGGCHLEWCNSVACERNPEGLHLSSVVSSDDGRLVMWLEMQPEGMPHLVVTMDAENAADGGVSVKVEAGLGVVRVPLFLVRGFLLGVAQLAGSVGWLEETQAGYVERLADVYLGRAAAGG